MFIINNSRFNNRFPVFTNKIHNYASEKKEKVLHILLVDSEATMPLFDETPSDEVILNALRREGFTGENLEIHSADTEGGLCSVCFSDGSLWYECFLDLRTGEIFGCNAEPLAA